MECILWPFRYGDFLHPDMPAETVAQLVRDFSDKIDAEYQNTPLSVLVLGPSMEATQAAGNLRRHIFAKAQDFGAIVTGEFKELVKQSRKLSGAGHNLCDYELQLALGMDALILIPASPGSFAELGLFALTDEICSKSLLLMDKRYSGDRSFVNLGAGAAYKLRQAVVTNINYDDLDAAWPPVKRFLEKKKSLKVASKRRLGKAAR